MSKRLLPRLKPPLETITFMGMMFNSSNADLKHFFQATKSLTSFVYVARRLLAHMKELALYRRAVLVTSGNALAARLAKTCFDLGIPIHTEAEARERLRQVEAAKAAKDDARDQAPRVQVVRALSADSAVVKAARRGDSVKRIDYAGTITFDERNDAATCRGDLQAYRTPEGFIRCRGRINGIGVYEYEDQDGNRWGELRLPEHVFAQEVLDAWKLAPLTDDHPAEGYVTPDNAQRLVVGSIGSVSLHRPDQADDQQDTRRRVLFDGGCQRWQCLRHPSRSHRRGRRPLPLAGERFAARIAARLRPRL